MAKYKMLANWKYGALYLAGKVYDFANLPASVATPTSEDLDEAIQAGYMEIDHGSGDPVEEPNIVKPMEHLGEVTDEPIAPAVPKGKQAKDTKET